MCVRALTLVLLGNYFFYITLLLGIHTLYTTLSTNNNDFEVIQCIVTVYFLFEPGVTTRLYCIRCSDDDDDSDAIEW